MSAKSLIIFVALSAASIGAMQIVKNRKTVEASGHGRLFLGPGTKASEGSQYFIYVYPLAYEQARADCNYQYNGQLAQFETLEEKELFEYYLFFYPELTDLGLGGRCGSDQGKYEWDDSTQILASVWGESNSNPIEPCQANHRVGARRAGAKFQLYGFPVNEPKQYVCEVNF